MEINRFDVIINHKKSKHNRVCSFDVQNCSPNGGGGGGGGGA